MSFIEGIQSVGVQAAAFVVEVGANQVIRNSARDALFNPQTSHPDQLAATNTFLTNPPPDNVTMALAGLSAAVVFADEMKHGHAIESKMGRMAKAIWNASVPVWPHAFLVAASHLTKSMDGFDPLSTGTYVAGTIALLGLLRTGFALRNFYHDHQVNLARRKNKRSWVFGRLREKAEEYYDDHAQVVAGAAAFNEAEASELRTSVIAAGDNVPGFLAKRPLPQPRDATEAEVAEFKAAKAQEEARRRKGINARARLNAATLFHKIFSSSKTSPHVQAQEDLAQIKAEIARKKEEAETRDAKKLAKKQTNK